MDVGEAARLGLGVYVLRYPLSAETLAQAWGGRGRRAAPSVANHDEDALTMAAAAFEALESAPARMGARPLRRERARVSSTTSGARDPWPRWRSWGSDDRARVKGDRELAHQPSTANMGSAE